MNRLALVLLTTTLVPTLALAGCGNTETKDEQPAESEASSSSHSPSFDPPHRSSTPEELKNQIHGVEGIRVSEIGDHLEVSFKASEDGDAQNQQATLNIILAVAEFTNDYEYVLIVGSVPGGTRAYSYDKSTVEEIAKQDDPVVSKIWDEADEVVEHQ